jgi:hypothetical protein
LPMLAQGPAFLHSFGCPIQQSALPQLPGAPVQNCHTASPASQHAAAHCCAVVADGTADKPVHWCPV